VNEKSGEFLHRLIGRWRGTVATWFEPGTPAVTSEVDATIRAVLDGRSVVHEYRSQVREAQADGMAVLGRDLGTGRHCVSWIDTFHTSGDVMTLSADDRPVDDGVSVVGAYAAANELWRWRITYSMSGADVLKVAHFNIAPDGTEMAAVEALHRRV
jgi:hypothetical protein